MKDIKTYINEQLEKINEEEETINSLEEFKEWARAKFEEVFGDDLDEEQFKVTLKGFLRDNKELVDKEDWGELVGMMNQSFAK